MILTVPAAYWMKLMLPVRVSANGLSAPSAFGKIITTRWADITRVRSLPFPGLPHLVVATTSSWWKLWVPLILTRLDEFTELVGLYGGTDHLLFQALWPRTEQR